MPSPISNDCLKVKIDGYTEPQLFPKLLLHVSFREPHNNIFSDKKYFGIREARYEDYNIIISDSTLRSLFPTQFKNIINIQGNVWLQMLHICQNYAFIVTVMA